MRRKTFSLYRALPQKGVTLVELITATTILLIVTSATIQLMGHPRERVNLYTQRAVLIDYMDTRLENLAMPFVSGTVCSHLKSDAGHPCSTDPAITASYNVECPSSNPFDSELDTIVNADNTLCFAKVFLNADCDPALSSVPNARQFCIVGTVFTVKGTRVDEALTTFKFNA